MASLSSNWANCESVATYRDEFTIAQANLDNVLVQYEAYLSSHPGVETRPFPSILSGQMHIVQIRNTH